MKTTILPDCEMLRAKVYGRREIEGKEYAYGYGGVIDLFPSIPTINERAEASMEPRICECCQELFKTDKKVMEPTVAEREKGRDRYHHFCKYCRHIGTTQRREKKSTIERTSLEEYKKAKAILNKNRKRSEIKTIEEIDEEIFARKTLGRSTRQVEERKKEINSLIAEEERLLKIKKQDEEFEEMERKEREKRAIKKKRERSYVPTFFSPFLQFDNEIDNEKQKTKKEIGRYIENLKGVYNQGDGILSTMTAFRKLLFILWDIRKKRLSENAVIDEAERVFLGAGIQMVDDSIRLSRNEMLSLVEQLKKTYDEVDHPY